MNRLLGILYTAVRIFLSFVVDNTVVLFFLMLLLLVVVAMILLLLVPLLVLLLLLLIYYEDNNITYSNGVLVVDQGELNTELTFSCNIRSTTTSINDYIYSTPPVQAKDNGFYKSQLVL